MIRTWKKEKMEKWKKEIEKIANWMKKYPIEAGVKGFVVGLSGGIDSSVIACLAARAVGRENVIGISLPCQSRKDMEDDAITLAENIGITLRVFDIIDAYKSINNGLKNGGETVENLTQANIKARLRMTMLYAIANQYNYLVAGTGNKSELDVGYFTKYGDGGVDIEPLGNYYKTEVYEMAELMPEIPESVKIKAPTADLWNGQTDEQELGMPYSRLDKILKIMEPYYAWHKVYENSHDNIKEEEFNKVRDMIQRSDHKNNLPPRYDRDKKVY